MTRRTSVRTMDRCAGPLPPRSCAPPPSPSRMRWRPAQRARSRSHNASPRRWRCLMCLRPIPPRWPSTCNTGAVVFGRNPGLSLVPASNEKLPITYTALETLGPDYRIATDVLGQGAVVGTTWRGSLVLQATWRPNPQLRRPETASRAGARRLRSARSRAPCSATSPTSTRAERAPAGSPPSTSPSRSHCRR